MFQDQIWPNFEIIQALMYVIVTCKYVKGSDHDQQLRKSGNTVFPIISLWGFFSDTKGQVTPQSVVKSRQISSSSSSHASACHCYLQV